MSTYEVLLFGHLVGVFLLLAAAGLSTGTGIAVARTTYAPTAHMLLTIMRYSEMIVTSVGALIVVVFGALLINEVDYSWGDPWISAAFALLIVVLAIDHGFLMPRARKARQMAASLGNAPVSQELSEHLNNPATIAAGMLLNASFLVFLYLMIAKPGA